MVRTGEWAGTAQQPADRPFGHDDWNQPAIGQVTAGAMTLSLLAGPIVLPNNDIEIVMDEIDRDGRADKTEITYDLGDLEQQFSWFFRNQTAWKNAQSVSQTDLVISASDADFSAADAYRGRNVVLFRQIDKLVVKPVDFLKTLLGEPLPLVSQKGVLWVRLNLFTGAN